MFDHKFVRNIVCTRFCHPIKNEFLEKYYIACYNNYIYRIIISSNI